MFKKALGFTNLIGALNRSENFLVAFQPIYYVAVVVIPWKTRVWTQIETDITEVPSDSDPFCEWHYFEWFSDLLSFPLSLMYE